jgi:hypothetical protein
MPNIKPFLIRPAIALLDQRDAYIRAARPYCKVAKLATANDPNVVGVWYDNTSDTLVIQQHVPTPISKLASCNPQYIKFGELPNPNWCPLVLTKTAEKPATLDYVKGVMGLNDLFYTPSPIAATLAGGALGAGLGYGGATIASRFLPEGNDPDSKWNKRKFRRMGALIGAGIGAAPGAVATGGNLLLGQSIFDGSYMKHFNAAPDKGSALKEGSIFNYPSNAPFDSNELLNNVWNSPTVSVGLTPKEKTLFTGAITTAQQTAQSPFLTPSDTARLTAGMGVGYASGLIAGKVLGAMIGLPVNAQNTLANTGMYAGTIKAITPMLFGGR